MLQEVTRALWASVPLPTKWDKWFLHSSDAKLEKEEVFNMPVENQSEQNLLATTTHSMWPQWWMVSPWQRQPSACMKFICRESLCMLDCVIKDYFCPLHPEHTPLVLPQIWVAFCSSWSVPIYLFFISFYSSQLRLSKGRCVCPRSCLFCQVGCYHWLILVWERIFKLSGNLRVILKTVVDWN